MDHLPLVLYMIFFRLALIATGITCIVLGYRLFILGVYPSAAKGKDKDDEVSAEVGGAKFTMKNAAPGTSFALFGVIIIAIATGLGGGSLRDMLLDRPVFWIQDQVFFIASYIYAVKWLAAPAGQVRERLFGGRVGDTASDKELAR